MSYSLTAVLLSLALYNYITLKFPPSPSLFSLPFLSFLILSSLILRMMTPNWIGVKCPKVPQTHQEVQKNYPSSSFCPFCGICWPDPINIDDSEPDSQSTHTTSHGSAQVFGIPPPKVPVIQLPSKRDRTSNFKKNFQAKAQEALQVCRPVRETNPYDHPAGLPIRLVSLLSFGEVQGDFFVPLKVTKLGSHNNLLFWILLT